MTPISASCHNLMIEKGRHYNILLEDRQCVYYETYIEYEFHFVMKCPLYTDIRHKFIDDTYVVSTSYMKFCDLMTSTNEKVLRNLAMYLFIIHFHILLGNQSIGCLGSHVDIFRNNILPYCCGIFFILDGTIGYRL